MGEKLIERVLRGEAITIDEIMNELGMGEKEETKSEPKHTPQTQKNTRPIPKTKTGVNYEPAARDR